MEEGEAEKTSSYGKRPLWHWILLYVFVAIVVYGLFYYFVLAKKGGTAYNQTQPTQQTASPTATPTAGPTAGALEKVTIEGNEFAFTPSKLTLKKGEEATITFKNTGTYPHNLTIADLDVKSKTVQPGEEDTFTFTPDKAGTFSFKCTVDSHAEKGMIGSLTVE